MAGIVVAGPGGSSVACYLLRTLKRREKAKARGISEA